MSNEIIEPRSTWTMRLISPKFNDELYLWMSTIPIFCGVMQFILSFFYYLRFMGLVFVGASGPKASNGGGLGALMLVILAFLFTIGLFCAFVIGFSYGFTSLGWLYERAPWLLYLWLTVVILGSMFKNSIKVKAIGDNADKYGLTIVYYYGMGLTAFLVLLVSNHVFENNMVETGGGNWALIPFGIVACFLSLFHGIIKPAITSIIVLYIRLFVKADDKVNALILQRNEAAMVAAKSGRKGLSYLRYAALFSLISPLVFVRLLDVLGMGQQVLSTSLAPYTFDIFMAMFGHIEMAIWLALIAWFAIAAIITPQRSLLAKLIRLSGKESLGATKTIAAIGVVCFSLLALGVYVDLGISNGFNKNNPESIILQKSRDGNHYLSSRYAKEFAINQPELFEVFNIEPPKKTTIFGVKPGTAKYKKAQKNYINDHYIKERTDIAQSKHYQFRQGLAFYEIALCITIFLGMFTLSPIHLGMYCISGCFMFLICATSIEGNFEYIDEIEKDSLEIIDKLYFYSTHSTLSGAEYRLYRDAQKLKSI
ncbi:hypothetical protein [Shewanella sp. MEBiC00475]|uniref:hypothetical protein n=1 Tax=Shewanella sp. MEBiC00475 TaxID=2575361 RepID=UPI0010C10189|nr:hypothetical protein [Shewanella sp. MEBiC00475]